MVRLHLWSDESVSPVSSDVAATKLVVLSSESARVTRVSRIVPFVKVDSMT